MQGLSRDEFLGLALPAPVWVPLPELGDGKGVFVRAHSARDKDAFDAETSARGEADDPRRLDNVTARYVCLCASDAEGKPLFTPADAAAVGSKFSLVLDQIFEAARTLNRTFQTPEEKDALLKNSGSASPSAGLPTTLPAKSAASPVSTDSSPA